MASRKVKVCTYGRTVTSSEVSSRLGIGMVRVNGSNGSPRSSVMWLNNSTHMRVSMRMIRSMVRVCSFGHQGTSTRAPSWTTFVMVTGRCIFLLLIIRYWIDGNHYKGLWDKGCQHGEGELYKKAQGFKSGYFENNVLVTEVRSSSSSRVPKKLVW